MKTILVTGGCGFIFSNFIRYLLNRYPDYKIINLDALTYAGRFENTDDFKNNPSYTFIKGNICDKDLVEKIFKEQKIDYVVHGAAETHVDRSIMGSQEFLNTNVFGTHVLLEAARSYGIERFLQIGTDEEYGSRKVGYFKESDILSPSSPYSSSKAAASLLALSYFKTYGLPVLVVRPTNNFGPYQFPEKFIPLFITNLLEDKPVPLYGYGLNRRDWIYVEDCCRAIDLVLHQGQIGEIYNIGAKDNEISNIEMTCLILERLKKPTELIQFVKDRPGHDFRYAVDTQKITQLGFEPEYDLSCGLDKTIAWYKDNEWWWRKIKDEKFKEYYQRQYGERELEEVQPPLEVEPRTDSQKGMTSIGNVLASEDLLMPEEPERPSEELGFEEVEPGEPQAGPISEPSISDIPVEEPPTEDLMSDIPKEEPSPDESLADLPIGEKPKEELPSEFPPEG